MKRNDGRWQLPPNKATGRATFSETYGQVLVDRTGINDPATSFNPGLRDWRVELRLQPQLLRFGDGDYQLPDACPDVACADLRHPSYNVVQKGRNGPGGPVGGFYKIEIMGYGGSTTG
ncbi:MAG: hypothetical protein M3Y71_12600 [Actinomycetota bacterium]|nr:hypothetical protein [Actinomycetota bacterium]